MNFNILIKTNLFLAISIVGIYLKLSKTLLLLEGSTISREFLAIRNNLLFVNEKIPLMPFEAFSGGVEVKSKQAFLSTFNGSKNLSTDKKWLPFIYQDLKTGELIFDYLALSGGFRNLKLDLVSLVHMHALPAPPLQ